MELTVKSLQGSYLVSGLKDDSTLADLKRMLHQQYRQQVPEPEEQRLVGLQPAAAACMHGMGRPATSAKKL